MATVVEQPPKLEETTKISEVNAEEKPKPQEPNKNAAEVAGDEVKIEDSMPSLEPSAKVTKEGHVEGKVDADQQGEVGANSRAEKKVKKGMEKLGLKPFKGVNQVLIRQQSVFISIAKPEVYKVGDSYVVFGVPQVRDLKSRGQAEPSMDTSKLRKEVEALTKQAQQADSTDKSSTAGAGASATTAAAGSSATEIGEPDMTGVDENDVKTIMDQAPGATKAAIVAALKANNGDLVNTIMALTGS